MTCGSCPENEGQPTRAVPNTVPNMRPTNIFQSLAATLPPENAWKGRYFGRPIIAAGRIEYPRQDGTPPPEIEGCRRDEENPFLFDWQWPSCMARMQGVKMLKSGAINVVMICNNPDAASNMSYVKKATCDQCPVRRMSYA